MNVKCVGCGDEKCIDDASVERGLVEFACESCGTEQYATKSGCYRFPERAAHRQAGGDDDALRDIQQIARTADELRASQAPPPLDLEPPPSVREAIRNSAPLGPLSRPEGHRAFVRG